METFRERCFRTISWHRCRCLRLMIAIKVFSLILFWVFFFFISFIYYFYFLNLFSLFHLILIFHFYMNEYSEMNRKSEFGRECSRQQERDSTARVGRRRRGSRHGSGELDSNGRRGGVPTDARAGTGTLRAAAAIR